jgi:hypothetical protein
LSQYKGVETEGKAAMTKATTMLGGSLCGLLLLQVPGCTNSVTHSVDTIEVTDGGLVFHNVSREEMDRLIDRNGIFPLRQWPIYNATNLPNYLTPSEFVTEAQEHPGQPGLDLGEYRVTPLRRGQKEYVFFYHEGTKCLVVQQLK